MNLSEEAIMRVEIEREYAWVIGAICKRYGPLKITFAEVLRIGPHARIEKHVELDHIEYRLRED